MDISLHDSSPRLRERIDLPNLALALFSVVVFAIVYFVQPMNPLLIPTDDSQSAFPHSAHSTVPTWAVAIIIVAAPLLAAGALVFLRRRFSRCVRTFRAFTALWMYILITVTSLTVTEVFKRYVGRARPDIFAVCGHNVQYEECKKTLSASELRDQFKSWPSGHSAMSMTSLYLVASFVQEAVCCRHAYAAFVGVCLIAVAIFVAASRINDFRHHADDVVAGLLIGYIVTSFMWQKCRKEVFREPTDINELE